jgi:hypothetical protein
MIDKFNQLVSNIDSKKSNRCIIPASTSSIYDSINNRQLISGLVFSFDGITLPINNTSLLIEDETLNVGVEANYNSGDQYIRLFGFGGPDIYVYQDGEWNSTLEYTLPDNFHYTSVNGLEQQKVLAQSIILSIEEHEETICALSRKVYGGTTGTGSIGFTNLWVDGTNGDDTNNGFNKTESIKTLSKAFDILNSASTGDKLITVHIAPGPLYNLTETLPVSMNRVEFIGESLDNTGVNLSEPLVFENSQGLKFKNLYIRTDNDIIKDNGLILTLNGCSNFEIDNCLFDYGYATVDYNDVGVLSLVNSNGALNNTNFSFTVIGTNTDIGVGAVRVSDNASFSWDNDNSQPSRNLQWLVINKEGWFFSEDKITNDTGAVPYSPDNTIGYYARAATKTVYMCKYFDTHSQLQYDYATVTFTMNLFTLVVENGYGTLSTVVSSWGTGGFNGYAVWQGNNPNLIFTNISNPSDTYTFTEIINLMKIDTGNRPIYSATSGNMTGCIRPDSDDLWIQGSGTGSNNYSHIWTAKMFNSEPVEEAEARMKEAFKNNPLLKEE